MKVLKAIQTVHGLLVFFLLFILLFPLLLIPILFPQQHRFTGQLNRVWAKLLFRISFIPYRVEMRTRLDSSRSYIFCPNHFSYLDIPTLGLNPINTIFVGKNDMERIPLFGYMYRKLHITVNRRSLRSKFQTYLEAGKAIEEGKSLVIYPEGGIMAKQPPAMARFKDGAFRIAIEKQIAIVPVTIPYNWIILPDQNPLLLRPGLLKVIFHEPVESRGLALDDIELLKKKVFDIIDSEIKAHGNHKGNPS